MNTVPPPACTFRRPACVFMALLPLNDVPTLPLLAVSETVPLVVILKAPV